MQGELACFTCKRADISETSLCTQNMAHLLFLNQSQWLGMGGVPLNICEKSKLPRMQSPFSLGSVLTVPQPCSPVCEGLEDHEQKARDRMHAAEQREL